MQPDTFGERTLTDLDHARLSKLLERHLPPTFADLLDCAEVTSSRAVPTDVVTMYSRVEIVDQHTHRRQTLTVCYPADALPATGFISVLSPVGMALLGQRVGSTARWITPTGECGVASIAAIAFQPEATGDYAR